MVTEHRSPLTDTLSRKIGAIRFEEIVRLFGTYNKLSTYYNVLVFSHFYTSFSVRSTMKINNKYIRLSSS